MAGAVCGGDVGGSDHDLRFTIYNLQFTILLAADGLGVEGVAGLGVGVEVEEFLEGVLAFAEAGAAGEAGEADGGDCGGVCADGGKAGEEGGAGGVEFCGGFCVDADEGVDGFAAGGVDGGDGVLELGEDAEPGGFRDGV